MDIYKALLCYFFIIPAIAFAHGGRTDKNGCHNDRKHGGYHCHNNGAPSPSYSPAVNSPNSSTTKVSAPTAQAASSVVRERNLAAYKELVLQIQAELNRLGYPIGKPSYLLLDVLVKKVK